MENNIKDTIKVNMFGGLAISYNDKNISIGKNKSAKYIQLLELVWLSGNAGIQKEQLTAILYDREEQSNLSNSFNNLIYQMHKQIDKSGLPKHEYIVNKDGVFFTDDEEPFIIEINPRQGGNELPRYVQEHCGIDYYRLLVTTSVGEDDYWNSLKNFKRKNRLITHHVLYPRAKGYFKGLQIDRSLLKYIYSSRLDVKPGDEVENTVDGASDIGYVDLEFSDVKEQNQVSLHLEDFIKTEIGQGKKK